MAATWKKIITVADVAADEAASVADGQTGLVTGNAVYDYIAAQGFGTGGGDIEGVTAGDGLSGGGTTGTVSLAVDSTVVRTTGAQTIAGDKTFSDNVIVSGDLTVNGEISSIDVQTLTVEDASILLSDGAGSAANADSSGLYVDTDAATVANRPHVLWKDDAGTTTMGWSMKDHGSGAEVGIAALTVQSGIASGTSYPAGTLWADSANNNLYIYI